MVLLKYFSNFWRTLERPLISYEINIDQKWSKYWFIVANNIKKATAFQITDTKLHVPAVTLSA